MTERRLGRFGKVREDSRFRPEAVATRLARAEVVYRRRRTISRSGSRKLRSCADRANRSLEKPLLAGLLLLVRDRCTCGGLHRALKNDTVETVRQVEPVCRTCGTSVTTVAN